MEFCTYQDLETLYAGAVETAGTVGVAGATIVNNNKHLPYIVYNMIFGISVRQNHYCMLSELLWGDFWQDVSSVV